jgi:DNA-binding NarL/FixJ family response regulator
MTIRVAVVDDHAIVRAGLRMVLEADPDFEVVGEADTAAAALELVRREQPHVALVDINLPDESGLRVAEEITRTESSVRLLMLSVHDDPEIVRESVRLGAHGAPPSGPCITATLTSARRSRRRWLKHCATSRRKSPTRSSDSPTGSAMC